MKTAKKVLSVVLSIMLVLGTVAVAVNAAYADPTTEHATFTLKAEVFDADALANAVVNEYKIDLDRAKEEVEHTLEMWFQYGLIK